jgi:hypothetical protein
MRPRPPFSLLNAAQIISNRHHCQVRLSLKGKEEMGGLFRNSVLRRRPESVIASAGRRSSRRKPRLEIFMDGDEVEALFWEVKSDE